MSVIDQIRRKAKERLMRVVLPEGDEPRTVEAAAEVAREGLARPILLGDPQMVAAAAAARGADITGIEVIDPENSDQAARYTAALYELPRGWSGTRCITAS